VGENRVVREKGGAFQTSRLFEIRTCFQSHAEKKREDAARNNSQRKYPLDGQIVAQGNLRSPKSRVRHFHLAGRGRPVNSVMVQM
jgi:hypothetical protein